MESGPGNYRPERGEVNLNSISASRFETFAGCTARYRAEYEEKTPRSENGGPADVGTACHGALEDYVGSVYFRKTATPDLGLLLSMYHWHFKNIFRIADRKDERYVDGVGMLKNWYNRTDLSNVEVISMEKKSSIPIKTKDGIKPYNYIWDRCDRFTEDGKTVIRVVDYKSYRKYMTTKEAKSKLQFKMYAAAAMAEFKDVIADEVWIQADMLRYGTVEVRFTIEECREIYRTIRETANMILDLPANKVQETIGPGCVYCVRKATCETLSKNIAGGGTFSVEQDPDAMAEALYRLENQHKASKYAIDEIKKLMLVKMEAEDNPDGWETDKFKVQFTSRSRRVINPREVALIVGNDIFKTLASVTVGEVDKLIKSGELDDKQCEALKKAMTKVPNQSQPVAIPRDQ